MNNPCKVTLPLRSSLSSLPSPRRGRPRKFTELSRAVTLTLPESVLAALADIDRDLSRAVVRVTQPEMRQRPHPPVELASFGRRAVIVVNPTRTLEQRTGVFLVPLTDGRALIAFDESVTAARLELTIQDALDDPALPPEDAKIFAGIRDLLRNARTSKSVSLLQRSILVIESAGRPAKRS